MFFIGEVEIASYELQENANSQLFVNCVVFSLYLSLFGLNTFWIRSNYP